MIGSAMSPSAIEGNKNAEIAALASEGVTFNDFIIEMAPGILLTIVPSFMLIRWLYKDEFSGRRDRDIATRAPICHQGHEGSQSSGTILCLVIIGFFLHPVVHIAVSWVALAGAVIVTPCHEPSRSLWSMWMDDTSLLCRIVRSRPLTSVHGRH